jgi:quercetin dioxygenase-like cupin family protein
VSAKAIRIAAGGAAITVAAAALTIAAAAGLPQDTRSRATTAFTGNLPVLDGRHLTATLLEVTFPPGGANRPHRHPCPVIGYVLEGAVRMQLQGQEEKVFKAGAAFFESPADVHAVSANASPDQPARLLAYFVCDHATALTVPVNNGEDRR